jgi:hypothetical protein
LGIMNSPEALSNQLLQSTSSKSVKRKWRSRSP